MEGENNNIYTRNNLFKDGKLDKFQKEFYELPFMMVNLIQSLRFEKRYEEADKERRRMESWGWIITCHKDGFVDFDWYNYLAWAKFFNNCELV